MAQVKSTYIDDDSIQIDESKNIKKFKDALNTLYDADGSDVESLVYIINSRNQFNERYSVYNVTGISEFKYSELQIENQKN